MPSAWARIAAGFETYQVIRKDGRKFVGLRSRMEADEIDITKADGDVVTLATDEIKEITEDKNRSVMPDDLIEVLTVKDFQDVLAYLIMQKGE